MKIDYLIKNGTIIDGSGNNRYEADILISDDLIISIFNKDQKTVKINDEDYNLKDLSQLIAKNAKPGDIVICLGAGTISSWAYSLPKLLYSEC